MQSFESHGVVDEAQALKYFMYLSSVSAPVLRGGGGGGGGDCKVEGSSDSGGGEGSLEDITRRLEALEAKLLGSLDPETRKTHEFALGKEGACVGRVFKDVKEKKCYSAAWKWVPSEYYGWDLEKRRSCLGAHNVEQLCKAMLMENKSHHEGGGDNRLNSRFYLVVVQYSATISQKKLEGEVRGLLPVEKRLTAKDYSFSVAKEADSDKRTGFKHNSVSPFGLATDVPIILDEAVSTLDVPFFWMGGGHVDLKLGMSVKDFVGTTNCAVLDVSEARAGMKK
mmetsp:Transcript_12494/g.24830  ORF Transcript_12494/g.24830 Transcript_12494/m.24830 type:complete len:281 (+) Transcript_12494:90-932(+)